MATQPFLTVPNVHTKLWGGGGRRKRGGRKAGEGEGVEREREWKEKNHNMSAR